MEVKLEKESTPVLQFKPGGMQIETITGAVHLAPLNRAAPPLLTFVCHSCRSCHASMTLL